MYYTEVNDLYYTIAIPQPTLTEQLDASDWMREHVNYVEKSDL